MQVEPIINARFKQFRQKYELEHVADGLAFERFVNYTIFSLHQPDAFTADSELLDFITVGGASDMGIDGLAIKVNGIIIKSKDDVNDIIRRFKRIEVEFIFVQCKYKPHFEKGELNNFVDGVKDFLSNTHHFPMNDAIKAHLELKEYILSDDVIIMWTQNPMVTLYYVSMGKWQAPQDLVGIANHFKQDIKLLNIYDDTAFNFVDSNSLKQIYDSIQNTFTVTIDTRHIMPLTDVRGVTNSCISIVYGNEFLKLITTEDGVIRKSLFNDNVRDFQGANPVNSEILSTILSTPEKFIILNNGITIVCDEFKQNNTKLSISNPQIVNGCQTSHVLYEARRKGTSIENVPVSIKFISTTNEDVVNDIVRGTNRQNIVLEEAFETTKKFHKDLEEVFNALSQDYEPIYYERRSKQYQHNPTIRPTVKVNLRILTQYFIGMFLNLPHKAHRHESVILKEHANDIFQDSHSKLPYYVAALAFLKLEKYFREGKLPSHHKLYKPHILMIFRESIAGSKPSLIKEKAIDNHSEKILQTLKDDDAALSAFREAISILESAIHSWVVELGKSRRGTKDVETFTLHLLEQTRKYYNKPSNGSATSQDFASGKVANIIRDKNGDLCGFISRHPDNIFFHSRMNPDLDFNGLKGKWVKYNLLHNPRNKSDLAVNVTVLRFADNQ